MELKELKLPLPYINPDTLQAYIQKSPENLKLARSEYSRLRKNVNRRIDRLNESQFKNTDVVRKYSGGFPKLEELNNVRELTHQLTELNRFAVSRLSSVTGQRKVMKENIQNLQGMFPYVEEKNYFEFLDFLEELRETGKLYIVYESEDAGEEYFNERKKDYEEMILERDEDDYDEEMIRDEDDYDEEPEPGPMKQAFDEFKKKKAQQISRAKAARRKQQAERERKQKASAKAATAKTKKPAKKGKSNKAPKRKGKKGKKRR